MLVIVMLHYLHTVTSAVQCEYSKLLIEHLVTIRFDTKPIHLFEIFEYLFKHNIYKGTMF